jgi:hypothetical protein
MKAWLVDLFSEGVFGGSLWLRAVRQRHKGSGRGWCFRPAPIFTWIAIGQCTLFVAFICTPISFLFWENRALPCTPFSFFRKQSHAPPSQLTLWCSCFFHTHTHVAFIHLLCCILFCCYVSSLPSFQCWKKLSWPHPPNHTVMFIPHSPHVASIHLFCFKLTQFSLFFQRRQTSA